jgi:hypothetical protein
MPYFQCPRCGGTDSFGQWEQRFNSQNISYRDNQNRQVGTSNGGFGVSNVRQQYCRSCMSVKMDMKFTQKDFKILGIVALLFFGIPILLSVGTNLAIGIVGIFSAFSVGSIRESSAQLSSTYYLISSLALIAGLVCITILRKSWIRKEDKKFLRDRFHKPKPPKSKKFMLGWFFFIYFVSNISYLIYFNGF